MTIKITDDNLEEAWLSGDISYQEACAIAEEMGYGRDDDLT